MTRCATCLAFLWLPWPQVKPGDPHVTFSSSAVRASSAIRLPKSSRPRQLRLHRLLPHCGTLRRSTSANEHTSSITFRHYMRQSWVHLWTTRLYISRPALLFSCGRLARSTRCSTIFHTTANLCMIIVICMYKYVHTYMYVYISLSLYVYIYIYVYICIYMYVYIYIYIYTHVH